METTADIVTMQPWLDGRDGDDEPMPVRYDVREGEAGRYLRCKEAPGVGVALDRSYAFSEQEARKLGERVILLDGAGQFAPLIDNAKLIYNLDHHESCQRAFTLASCEQALILVLKGLELDKGDWRILANEPDLDTIFAIWVLLNYRRVRALEPAARDAIVPMLRLEGAIDANGYEIAEYCGLPSAELAVTKAKLDGLFAEELALKQSGGWGKADLLEYTRDRLIDIDHLVYDRADFGELASVEEEYGHVEIGDGKVAVVCRDASGIYEVERRLKEVWGDRLGVIALAKDGDHYTLRRSASLADIDLEHAYRRLNQLDPVVDGRPPEKRWGGSDEIGGSPRPSGTALSPADIVRALRQAYQAPDRRRLLRDVGVAVLVSALIAIACAVAFLAWNRYLGVPDDGVAHAGQLAAAALASLGGALLATGILGHGRVWAFGCRRPAGTDWVALLPAVLAGGALGGVWVPHTVAWDGGGVGALAVVTAVAALATALWFTGVVHGVMARRLPIQLVRGRWFVSRPALLAALLYAAATLGAGQLWLAPAPSSLPWTAGPAGMVWQGGAAFVAGLGAAMIRERSLSVLTAAGALFLGAWVRILMTLT